MSAERTYVIRPEDARQDWRIARAAMREACQMAKERPVEVVIRRHRKRKTDPQNRTMWMWHLEVAAQLTERCREMGQQTAWTKDDVHEVVFKGRCMPQRERVLPDGECVYVPMGTSDKAATVDVMSEAMTAYLAWIYGHGMEVTIPPDPLIEQIVGRAA